ncbi:hypothetical protein B0O99DRAFT_686785 [Bisporella sp. PMI_857]|nr:hypothetical protein B0O99DRAFT_686785 [Bisporella sp. PMI_857]
MDPLSVTASVVALLSLTVKVGTVLTTTIQDAKNAPKELTQISQEVKALRAVLHRLRIILEEDQLSNVLRVQPTAPDMGFALTACKATMRDIREKTTRVKSLMEGGSSFDKLISQYSWVTVRKELQDLRVQLEYSKTSILMSLQLQSLEALKAVLNVGTKNETCLRELLLEVQALRAQYIPPPDPGRQVDAVSPLSPPEKLPHVSESVSKSTLGAEKDSVDPWNHQSPFSDGESGNLTGNSSPMSKAENSIDLQSQSFLDKKGVGEGEIEVHSSLAAWLSASRSASNKLPSDSKRTDEVQISILFS